ncbi:hypothetical protein COSO111634_33485 [Corallococcus soli]
MKGVAPSSRLNAHRVSRSDRGIVTEQLLPRNVCTAGRGRSVGSSSACGAPPSCRFQ